MRAGWGTPGRHRRAPARRLRGAPRRRAGAPRPRAPRAGRARASRARTRAGRVEVVHQHPLRLALALDARPGSSPSSPSVVRGPRRGSPSPGARCGPCRQQEVRVADQPAHVERDDVGRPACRRRSPPPGAPAPPGPARRSAAPPRAASSRARVIGRAPAASISSAHARRAPGSGSAAPAPTRRGSIVEEISISGISTNYARRGRRAEPLEHRLDLVDARRPRARRLPEPRQLEHPLGLAPLVQTGRRVGAHEQTSSSSGRCSPSASSVPNV